MFDMLCSLQDKKYIASAWYILLHVSLYVCFLEIL